MERLYTGNPLLPLKIEGIPVWGSFREGKDGEMKGRTSSV